MNSVSSQRSGPVYAFGACTFAPTRHELCRDGVLQAVTPQVFELLRHLIENRDQLVSKDELNAVIWNGRAISDSSLSTCVKLARQAIGDSGKRQEFIRTVPRRGYRFVGEVLIRGIEAKSEPAAASHPMPVYHCRTSLPLSFWRSTI